MLPTRAGPAAANGGGEDGAPTIGGSIIREPRAPLRADGLPERDRRWSRLRAAGRSLIEYRNFTLHGLFLSLAVVALVTTISGSAFGLTPSTSLLSSKPVAETNAGYLHPPVLLLNAPAANKQAVSVHSATGPVETAIGDEPAVAPAQEQPVDTPDATAAPQVGYFTYTVQPGDTLDSIANAYGIDPAYMSFNNPEISDPDSLIIGGTLLIPATNGLVYHVTLGDTLNGIADAYGIDTNSIVSYAPNGLRSPDDVVEGAILVLPNAALPAPVPESAYVADPGLSSDDERLPAAASVYSTGYAWPIGGNISQYFGEPELGSYHKGIDIEGGFGAPIAAAAAGTVVLTAWDDYGLGYHVIIDHGNGMQTIYAHLSDIWVGQGQYVGQGEAVGALGSTGYSTGPHLHFQMNLYGTPVNPFGYLP